MVFLFERIGSSANKHSCSSSCSRKMCLASSSTCSLNSFESEVSKYLLQLSLNSSCEILTFPWLEKCLQMLPKINKAFAKLVVDIDYPMDHWEVASIDEYLNHNLTSMESLNSITSSISHLSRAHLAASHALSRLEAGSSPSAIQRLKAIEFASSNRKCREGHDVRELEQVGRCSPKEWIIRQALAVKKQVCYWVFRVVESSINGDLISCCSEMRKEIRRGSSSVSLSLKACEDIIIGKNGVLKEVAQVKEGLALILAAAGDGSGEQFGESVKKLRTGLVVLGKLMESFEDDVNKLFSEVLLNRNEMMDIFQQINHF